MLQITDVAIQQKWLPNQLQCFFFQLCMHRLRMQSITACNNNNQYASTVYMIILKLADQAADKFAHNLYHLLLWLTVKVLLFKFVLNLRVCLPSNGLATTTSLAGSISITVSIFIQEMQCFKKRSLNSCLRPCLYECTC